MLHYHVELRHPERITLWVKDGGERCAFAFTDKKEEAMPMPMDAALECVASYRLTKYAGFGHEPVLVVAPSLN